MRFTSNNAKAFTFVEVLATMLFMAILIPVVVEGLQLASRASTLAERRTVAAQLAENMLNEITLNQNWQDWNTSGDFDEDYPGYSWTLVRANWEYGDLTLLTLRVDFEVKGEEHYLELSTLVDESVTDETMQTQ